MICATCRYALPVDPDGHWRNVKPEQWVHCALSKGGTATVIPKERECGWQPSKWEPMQ